LIVDTGAILQLLETRSESARAIARTIETEPSKLILPQTVAAELDYMLNSRGGRLAGRALLEDLAANRFEVPCLESPDFATIASLNERYFGLSVGLVDLSIVVMAARYGTTRVLTLDQRHFRAMHPLQGGVFTILPFDQDIAGA
jgi:predicted nucleic acid-binding protein